MNRLSLRPKLFIIFTSLILIFTLFGIYTIFSTEKFTGITKTIYDRHLQVSNASLEVLTGVLRMQKTMKELLVIKDKQQFFIREQYLEQMQNYVEDHIVTVENKILGAEGKRLVEKVYRQFLEWEPLRGEVIKLIKEGKKKQAMSISRSKYQPFMLVLEGNIILMRDYASNRADDLMLDALESRRVNLVYTMVFGATVILFSVAASFLFGVGLLRQLGADPNELTDVAEKISAGELDIDIKTDEHSGVYKVMGEMVQSLRNAEKEHKLRQWLRKGVVGFDDVVRGESNINKLADLMIENISEYLSCFIGSFYLSDSKGDFELYAGWGTDPKFPLRSKIKFGEGLIGSAAKKKEPVLYKDVADDYIKITSSLGETEPTEILVVPVLYEKRVIGAIELAKAGNFSEVELEYVGRVAENMGISINMAKSQTRVSELLKQTQQQAEELQQQQEELRVSNEELEEHTKLLQESEKRLQQQQEELRVSNEELEERSKAVEEQRDEIKKKNDQLVKTQKEVMDKAKALEEASRYKSEFLANMSHELRTPLNSILILSQLLSSDKKGNLDQKQIEYAETIFKSGNNLFSLINDVLDLSKIEAGRFEANVSNFDIREMVEEITAEMKPMAEESELDFISSVDDAVPRTVSTDKTKLGQVFKNLLSNAIKFTEKGSVELRLEANREDVVLNDVDYRAGELLDIHVKDTGVGIPSDKIDHVFEAFRQVDGTTSRKYGGTGLGLTICRRICKLLEGVITVESKVKEGTVFTVQIPVALVPRASDTKSEAIIEKGYAPLKIELDDKDDSLLDKDTILIIEDDQHFAEILRGISEEKGFIPITAPDGEKGLYLADYYKPKAIILDVALPGIDGFDVMRRLKENSATKSIPVHFISADDMSMKAMQMGAIGFLTKPVSTESLNKTFKKIESVVHKAVKNLLIVEDNDIQRQSIVELIGNGDVKSTAVATGEEAYQKLLSEDFDCMILDLGLGDMDGLQFLNRIQSDSDIADIPVIIYTGKDLTQKEEQILQQYAGSIIIKGARSPERLLAETSLFLHRVESDLPESKKRMLDIVNSDSVLKDKKVLIVDDDMRNVFALSSVLEENGMLTEIAVNGAEALEKAFESDGIDLILMDIMMPVMDGYEATRRIRETDKGKSLPIIALTAKAMPADRAKCIEAGANEYMSKPVNTDKLLSLLRVWLYK